MKRRVGELEDEKGDDHIMSAKVRIMNVCKKNTEEADKIYEETNQSLLLEIFKIPHEEHK